MALTEVLRSDTFEQWRTKTNTVASDLGDRATLSANITANTSLVGAINELQSDIGVIGSLSTFSASNIVSALNELKTGSSVTISGTKTFSSNLNLSSGQAYTIDGTSVLNATTLGSGVVTSSLTTVGTIGTGVWQGTIVSPTYGGTGINNGSRTLTIGTGNLSLTTAAGGSSLTLPASGTVATLAGAETLTTKTINLASNTLTGTLAQFNTALSDDDFAALAAAQTLTNKTITLGGNTITGTLAQFNTALTDDDFAALAAAQTLTNKSLQDSTTFFVDDADTTKKLQFQLSGITTNTTRTLTVPNNSGTIALTSDVTFVGTTSVSLSRGSGNLALTGISSVTLPGSTSGTVLLQPVATAGTTTITLPATTGTVVTTGDSGTVTNTMLAGSIANAKLSNSSVTFNGVAVALGASGTITSTTTNTLTIGDGLSGTSFNGSAAVTIAADSTIARRADTHFIGTTSVALNRTSGALALTGISSVQFPTAGTNTITLTPASTNAGVTLTMPAITGTVVVTGSTNTVTTGMITDANVTNVKLANPSLTIGSTSVALGATVTSFTGLTSVTSAAFSGPLTGNVTGSLVTANGVVIGNAANTVSTSSGNLALTSTGGTIVVTGNETVSGTLDVSGKTQTITTLGDGSIVFAVVNNNSGYTNGFPSAQQGANRFTVDTAGTVEIKGDLIVRGATTITGTATISADFNTLVNKPSPVIGVSLSSDLSGSGTATLTSLGAGTYTIGVAATIANNAVTAAKIAADAVTTAKILDANVTNAKLANKSVTVNPGTGMSGGGSVDLGATITLTNSDRGSSQNIFKTFSVAGSTSLVAASNSDTLAFASDGTLSITTSSIGTKTVNITHATMGSQASVDNSGGTVIQDVTLNNGHVTGLTSVNLDTRFAPINTETLDSVTTRGSTTTNGITVGSLTVTGNLTVSGTTTSINTTTLDVVDLNINVAKNATTAAAANGAGLTVGTYASNPTLLYGNTNDRWVFNRGVEASSIIRTGGTASQFLKADGTVDSNTYLTTSAAASTYQPIGSYLTGNQSISVTGAVTGSGTTSIVTTFKTFAANTILGNNTGSTAVPAELTVAQVQTMLGLGSMAYASTASYQPAGNYQPLDADLTAIAGLSSTGFLKRTGTDTWTLDNSTYLTTSSAASTYQPIGSYVDLSSSQTITGVKTLTNVLNIENIETAGYGIALKSGNTLPDANASTRLLINMPITNTVRFQAGSTTNLRLGVTNGYIELDSSTGNLTVQKDLTVSGTGGVTAAKFVVSGGTSAQFLKANGTVDTNTYLTSYSETSTLQNVTSRGSTTSTSITAASFIRTSATSTDILKGDGSIEGESNYIKTTGNQTAGGVKTFSSQMNLSDSLFFDNFGITTGIYFRSSNSNKLVIWYSSNTAIIGAGSGVDITVGGTNPIRVKATTGALECASSVTATSFVKSGGTNAQFLKADGSVDSSTYLTTAVTSVTAGSGISVTGTTSVAIANTGVTSITGTSNQITASASTGGVTLSLPQSINTGASVQFGSIGVGTAASGVSGEIRAIDNITAYYTSDERLKTNVRKIENALDKVTQINGVVYDWNDTYKKDHGDVDGYFVRNDNSGVIAQEVEKVFPNVVGERADGFKAVRYELLVPLLIEAIKDLKAEVESLKANK